MSNRQVAAHFDDSSWKSFKDLTFDQILEEGEPARGRSFRIPREIRRTLPSWNKEGLEALVSSAKKDFEAQTGVALPWNLEIWGPYVGFPRKRYHLIARRNEMVEDAARFAGWLRYVAENHKRLPLVMKLIERTVSSRGMNSPRTHLDLWRLVERHPSPGRLEHILRKLKISANQILEPYGLKVSWRGIALALQWGDRRTRRAAFFAAAETVTHVFRPRYQLRGRKEILPAACALKAAREQPQAVQNWLKEKVFINEPEKDFEFADLRSALEAAKTRLVHDTTDGVELWLDTATEQKICGGISVTNGWQNEEVRNVFFVRYGERTFHSYAYNARQAVKDAVAAWRQQD